ncbi:hypothetical protein C8R45DRAFT_1084545 [Mycena sanguinolenta]|nr:hypothetical protein C8R45DRAFT_1084545 [Mycena sanguinolenta]
MAATVTQRPRPQILIRGRLYAPTASWMVLTRSATRAQNPIVRWLPNEILAAVMSAASPSDLVALCKTSRLMRNITTPLLYRAVELSNGRQLEAFLRTIKSPAASSRYLLSFVREFIFRGTNRHLTLTPFVDDIASALLQFSRLECLDLLFTPLVEFTHLLDRGCFANLATFRYTIEYASSNAMVSQFVHRHPTITRLALVQQPLQQFDLTYTALPVNNSPPNTFVPFILQRFVLYITLSCSPADPDVESRALPNKVALLVSQFLGVSTILVGVLKYLPHARALEILKSNGTTQITRGVSSHVNRGNVECSVQKLVVNRIPGANVGIDRRSLEDCLRAYISASIALFGMFGQFLGWLNLSGSHRLHITAIRPTEPLPIMEGAQLKILNKAYFEADSASDHLSTLRMAL